MAKKEKPQVPYVEATIKGGRQKPSLIVLQSSGTSAVGGAARAIAMTFHKTNATKSFHYVVDELGAVNCVDPIMGAAHSGDNVHSIGILMCDDASTHPNRWDEQIHSLMLAQLADLVAQLCLIYGIRPRYLSEVELKKWRKWRSKRRGGIVVKGQMMLGYWPIDYFFTLVEANIAKYQYLKTY